MVSTPRREHIPPVVEAQVDPHTLAQMGIAMLIDLAQRGEIDPWDVKVIDAIDLHLSKLPLQSRRLLGAQASQSLAIWASLSLGGNARPPQSAELGAKPISGGRF